MIGKNTPQDHEDEKLAAAPRFVKSPERAAVAPPRIPEGSKMFREDNVQHIDASKPVVRLVKPEEIPSGTAPVGERRTFAPEKADALIGKTIKGRFLITQKTSADEASISYLADDKIIADKKVVVRILLEDKRDDFLSKIMAEERVALSHLSHPNIASLIDSGQLTEGTSFIITEFIDAFSLQHKLSKLDQFNPLRAARIVKQIAHALGDAHQNGILHRGLCPENIFLTISEAGVEQAKITGFGIGSGRKSSEQNLVYVSPEQLEGKSPSYASDIYSLAAITFRMLTGRPPFAAQDIDRLLKAQKTGLTIRPSNLRLDIKPEADDVLAKAMSYDPAERYANAREFGDALYNALSGTFSIAPAATLDNKPKATVLETTQAELVKDKQKSDVTAPILDEKIKLPSASVLTDTQKLHDVKIGDAGHRLTISAKADDTKEKEHTLSISAAKPEVLAPSVKKPVESPAIKPAGSTAWVERSPDAVNVGSSSKLFLYGLLILGLFGGLAASIYYFLNRPQPPIGVEDGIAVTSTPPVIVNPTPVDGSGSPEQILTDIEAPPTPREMRQPPNTEFFENNKEGLKGDLLRSYRGFKFFYPKGWKRTETFTAFVDVASRTENGLPLEQMVVSYYPSKGTFKEDSKNFPKLVEDANKKFAKSLTNYKFVSSGETFLHNGRWKAYEMKFQSSGKAGGQDIMLWGRTLFIPAARPGTKYGIAITMLATSLSPQVKGVDDVGNKGDLAMILENFEPSQSE